MEQKKVTQPEWISKVIELNKKKERKTSPPNRQDENNTGS